MLETLENSLANFNVFVALGILCMYIVTDALYALYSLSISDRRPLAAANTSALIHLLIAVGVLSYVENFLYIFPVAIGSWIGTYLLVGRSLKKKKSVQGAPTSALME